MRYKSTVAGALTVVVVLTAIGLQHNAGAFQAATPQSPTTSFTNLDPLDIESATLYQSVDFVIQFKLPAGWQYVYDVTPGFYMFQYNALGGRSMRLLILVGKLQAVYKRLISFDDVVRSPQDFLEKLKARYQFSVISFKDIHAAKVGIWDGYGVQGQGPLFDQGPDTLFDQRIVLLSDGTALFVSLSANNVSWQRADALFDEILNSLVVNASLLPASAPDLPSLQLTATAVQAQIDSLMSAPAVPDATTDMASQTPTSASKATP
jgi:hypothetical protein